MLQVMKPSERYDPAHVDGGASLLHGGLTIFGSRNLESRVSAAAASEEDWEVLPQRPGSFYVGSLCAPGIVYDTSSNQHHFAQQLEMFTWSSCCAQTYFGQNGHVIRRSSRSLWRCSTSSMTSLRPHCQRGI
ncbi:hypothetical protein N9L68_02615 [bacterium]|nr:hypothetical protein [bacterium]